MPTTRISSSSSRSARQRLGDDALIVHDEHPCDVHGPPGWIRTAPSATAWPVGFMVPDTLPSPGPERLAPSTYGTSPLCRIPLGTVRWQARSSFCGRGIALMTLVRPEGQTAAFVTSSASPRPTSGPTPIRRAPMPSSTTWMRTGVAHCSWKSNEHLAAALAGETDLDLLVDHDAESEFHAVAARHGLKQLVPPRESAFPGMEHLLGLDHASGRLFHLHVHYQLVLGEQFVKNHRLADRTGDAARHVLGRTEYGSPVPSSSSGCSSSARCSSTALATSSRTSSACVSPGIRDALSDRAALAARAAPTTPPSAPRSTACPALPTDIVCDFLAATARTRRPAVTYLRLRHRTRVVARRRRTRLDGRVRSRPTGSRCVRRRRRGRSPRMTPVAGGGSLALVGADGAGKSTTHTQSPSGSAGRSRRGSRTSGASHRLALARCDVPSPSARPGAASAPRRDATAPTRGRPAPSARRATPHARAPSPHRRPPTLPCVRGGATRCGTRPHRGPGPVPLRRAR